MATVTRRFTCKDCEEVKMIKYSQEEINIKADPESDDDYLILMGLCKACFDGKME